MISPASRLLLLAGLALPPLLLGTAAGSPLSLAAIGVMFALAAADAAATRGTFRGIGAELPGVVRLAVERRGKIALRLRHEGKGTKRLRVGLSFPRELRPESEEMRIDLAAGEEGSRIEWAVTPRERGRYLLDRCYLESRSPLGLWTVRSSVPAGAEIRVYPDLLSERSTVGGLFLNRGMIGVHSHRQIGKGRDFEQLREYAPGDSYEDVHWKATAKRGAPVTKVFQVERTQELYVIVDASRLCARTVQVPGGGFPAGKPSLERSVTAAMILSLAAQRQGDRFGLITFSDRVHGFLRAGAGKAHSNACLDALYTLHPNVVSPDFDELATFIRLRLRRRALLVYLTALDDPLLAEGFARSMDLICRHHLVLVAMLNPPSARPLFQDSGVSSLDDLYRSLGGHAQWNNLRELGKVLRRRGVMFSLLDGERMCAQLVSRYIEVKKRQIL